jgi:hypothetical protein
MPRRRATTISDVKVKTGERRTIVRRGWGAFLPRRTIVRRSPVLKLLFKD